MRIIDLNYEKYDENTVVGLGNFDGFHLGHQSLFHNVKKQATKLNAASAILIFKTHTKQILTHSKKRSLTTFKDKLGIAKKLGLDIAFVLDFNDTIASKSPEEFIENILKEKMHSVGVVVGHNFHFGNKALGTVKTLQKYEEKYNYQTFITESVFCFEEIISSSRIRHALENGDIALANKCLGRPYRIYGKVIDGKHRGRILGFPTANITLENLYIIPKTGVYVTTVYVNGTKFRGMTFIGNNLTFNENDYKIETHILNFQENLYGKFIKIEFHKFLRGNVKFNSSEELINQMNMDKERANIYFAKNGF